MKLTIDKLFYFQFLFFCDMSISDFLKCNCYKLSQRIGKCENAWCDMLEKNAMTIVYCYFSALAVCQINNIHRYLGT